MRVCIIIIMIIITALVFIVIFAHDIFICICQGVINRQAISRIM